MSLESRPYWTVLCDGCQRDAFADDDCTAYRDAKFALEVLRETGWWLITGDGRHYCADCCVWDEERDERVPRP
jgi:hypothetical protein